MKQCECKCQYTRLFWDNIGLSNSQLIFF